MTLQIKNGTSNLLIVSGSLANDAACCCETDCCYDDRTSIDISGLTGNWSGLNGTYALSPAFGGNCRSDYNFCFSLGCVSGSGDSYHIECITVGTNTTSAGPNFLVSVYLYRCLNTGFGTRQLYITSSRLCGTTSGSISAATSAPTGFPTGFNWSNLT